MNEAVMVQGPFDGSTEEVDGVEDVMKAEMSGLEKALMRLKCR